MDREEKEIIKSYKDSNIEIKPNHTDYLILSWGLFFVALIIITFIVGFVRDDEQPNLIPWIIYFIIGLGLFIYKYIRTKKYRFLSSIIICAFIIIGLIFYILNKK
jgi:hypothetical protein